MRLESIKPGQQLSAIPQQWSLQMENIKPVHVTGAALLVVFLLLLAIVQLATPSLAGNDGYYHIKLAQVMREQGMRPTFTWLPLTILNAEAFYDHHFLYHILLIPFTLIDLRMGAKLAGIIFPGITFISGWLLLRGQRVPYAALWSLGFIGVSSAFLYRMSMPRVQALSLLVLLLALHLTFHKHYRWLALLGFLYVWLYNAFPLIVVVVGVYTAMRWLIDGRLEFAPLAYSGLGVMVGLVLNPYFPDNLVFIYHHLAPKLTDATATKVGNEWYPYQTWTLVKNSTGALLAFGTGIFALGLSSRKMSSVTATMLTLCLLFGTMLFKSRRFIEYFPAFALLFSALAWAPLLKQWSQNSRRINQVVPVLLVALLLPGIWWSVQNAQDNIQRSKPAGMYAEASVWLKENTPAGSRVFQTDWDDFTRLFFYNTHNSYVTGLDPTYLQRHNPELYNNWVDITKGRVGTPAQIIKEDFGARYIISDLKHKKFLQQAEKDPEMTETYRDDHAVIFKIETITSKTIDTENSGGNQMK